MSRRTLSGFVSYARDDSALVERFLALMAPRCRSLREVEFDAWWDRKILVGKLWEPEIRQAIGHADFGLLCVTPSFLASRYIADVELPGLLADERCVLPVGIDPVDLHRVDLKGLDDLWIFGYRPKGAGRGRWFSECAGPNRGRFCNQLVGEMWDRLVP